MAMSVNGIIAKENEDEDFLSDENWKTFKGLAENCGCFIIGRRTYENVKEWEDHSFNEIKNSDMLILSKKDMKITGCTIVNSPKEAIQKAKEKGCKELLLSGGGITNTSFIKENLIDEIILNIEPAILGKGIKIFKENDFEKRLKLINTKNLKEDIMQLHYKVIK